MTYHLQNHNRIEQLRRLTSPRSDLSASKPDNLMVGVKWVEDEKATDLV